MTKRRLYLDLDGVFADFDAAFPAVFGLDHRTMADDAMWERINAHPSFFADLPMCSGADVMWWAFEHLQPTILTACPRTNYAHVARQKRAWVQRYFGADVTVLPVLGGHNKPLFMHAPGDVLVDDFEKNCTAWAKEGGVAVLHRYAWETIAAVQEAFSQVPA